MSEAQREGVQPVPTNDGSEAAEAAAPRREQAARPAGERDVVVCSFYTPDEYYGGHAARLRQELEELGLRHELLELQRSPGDDWADVTRRKIGFVHGVCERNPDAMVFWIDVDCSISELPDYVRSSTADFIGFQRSFGTPLQIGYHGRTRFWEPSFWGVNATPLGRKLVQDAYDLERRATLKATDDYFLEEAWRANAGLLTFQMIPSTALVRGSTSPAEAHRAFFGFGSSGNVAEFKSKVTQHKRTQKRTARQRLRDQAKKVEGALGPEVRQSARQVADKVGVTDWLTRDAYAARALDKDREQRLRRALTAAMDGDRATFGTAVTELRSQHVLTFGEERTLQTGEAFLEHSERGPDVLRLAWWYKPFPGNFGDWLSPMLVGSVTDDSIRLKELAHPTRQPHLVALGSVGRFVRPSSIVVGTGLSREDVSMSRKATYVSVRGPLTARVLAGSGGPRVEAFGDPGVLLSRVVPLERGATNGRVALVRHFSHRGVPLSLPDHVDELSVLMSRPADIRDFLATLVGYDSVVTSAMHVLIACQSYGIPCALVTFAGFESEVHGSGMKYADYAQGAGVPVLEPVVVPRDLRHHDLSGLVTDLRVDEAKKDEVAEHLRTAVRLLHERS